MPTPSRAGTIPVRTARIARGPWALVARAAALFGIAALPVAFNAWIDPARLVAPRTAERDIARVLAAGSNVTNYANYDDRAIERAMAPRRARPEVLVLGSSRMQMLRDARCALRDARCATFVNGAMQGATPLSLRTRIAGARAPIRWAAYACAVLTIMTLGVFQSARFIYFQF